MLTDIRSLLQANQITPEDSVYENMPEVIFDYPITIGDFIEPGEGENTAQQFAELCEYREYFMEKLHASEDYQKCDQRVRKLGKMLKRKRVEEEGRVLDREELEKIKKERKNLQGEKRRIQERIEENFQKQYGYDFRTRKALLYKNTVYISWFLDLLKMFPELSRVKISEIKNIPLFVSRLESLRDAVSQGEKIGMVGGPCLFGVDEVFLKIKTEDGNSAVFDCSCGRRCLAQNTIQETVEEYIAKNGAQITRAEIINNKAGITRQEYDSIKYLFSMAEIFEGKVVIPLPDMSYFKYMEKSLLQMERTLQEEVMQKFKEECYGITDKYIDLIKQIADDYPTVEYRIMHERSKELCHLFYEKREKYIKGSSYMQKITNKDGKKEAVVDYITMLALPYYLYGTKYVIQLDSVDETDSGRKCMKIHKGDIELTQILYPEYLSRDGKNTIYNTSAEFKDYIPETNHL